MGRRELDAEVAEKVMGWKSMGGLAGMYWDDQKNICRYTIDVQAIRDKRGIAPGPGLFAPSINISAAFQVVEKMRERGYVLELVHYTDGDSRARFTKFSEDVDPNVEGKGKAYDIPEAICLAALRALAPREGDAK